MQETSFFSSIIHALQDVCTNGYAMLSGIIISVLGYFLPVSNIVNLLVFFFIIDVAFGYWAANKLRGERFSVKIIWSHTIPRMLISIVLIIGSFMWDSVYNQDVICTYKIIGWFISGVLLYSIAENGYKITKWSVFPKIGGLFKKNIKDNTGLDIGDENK